MRIVFSWKSVYINTYNTFPVYVDADFVNSCSTQRWIGNSVYFGAWNI